jgi:hypothetical protein
MENLREFKQFKGLKKGSSLITENVISQSDAYEVIKALQIPKSLVKAYIKKIKDESGQNMTELYGENIIAEKIIDYIATNYMNIENLPVSILLGSEYDSAQVQPAQAQVQLQPQGQENIQAQATAQEIGGQEEGQGAQIQIQDEEGQPQVQIDVQTQGQGQLQGGQSQEI